MNCCIWLLYWLTCRVLLIVVLCEDSQSLLQCYRHTVAFVFIPGFDVVFLCSVAPSSVSVPSVWALWFDRHHETMFSYLYAKQRQGERHQLEWFTVHRERSNWTEGCWLWMCKITLQGGKKRHACTCTCIQFRHLDKDKRPCESFFTEFEGKADAQRSLFIRPEWGLCSSPVVPCRLLWVEEVEDSSEEV